VSNVFKKCGQLCFKFGGARDGRAQTEPDFAIEHPNIYDTPQVDAAL
jgi:hypothetical protein